MSREPFDRLRELVPALDDVQGHLNADVYGVATLGVEALRAIVAALEPCLGCDGCAECLTPNCDTCGEPYDPGSRDGRCGDCGECAKHCEHDLTAAWCSCVCNCTYRLHGYVAGETLCGACLDNCGHDAEVTA